jgi:hypothetical protein
MYHLHRILNIICLLVTTYYAFTDDYTKATYFFVGSLYMEILASKEEDK